MSNRITPRRALKYFAIATFLSVSFAYPRPALATEVAPLTLTETVRQAQTVVVGSVISKKTSWGTEAKRWMVTEYTIGVEEVIVAGEGTSLGKTIVVRYWGGTLDGETQAVSDTRLPVVGEHLLFMLRAGWQKELGFSPVVGLNYGLFCVAPDRANGPPMVHNSNGAPLVREADQMVWTTPRGDPGTAVPGVELSAFVEWLRANVAKIKSAPSELKPQSDRTDPRVLKVFAKTQYLPDPVQRQTTENPARKLPATDATAATIPLRPEATLEAAPTAEQATDRIEPDYSVPRVANLPIVVNNFQSSFTPWSPEDQYQLSKWNYYGNVFQVYTTPTGNWAWQNNRFDLCGFPSSADMQAQFGVPWDPNTIGICYTRWNSSNIILEGDIALNPAWSFTLDDEWVHNGGSARSFRQVLSHELGHMWGLAHQFNFLSIMNDSQDIYRFFAFPYMDDAEAIRIAYPGALVARTDLAIYLRYSVGTQNITDAIIPTEVNAGSTLTVSNYHLENVGTTTITTPTLEWYLTPGRNYNSSTYYLGTSTHGSLARYQYFTPNGSRSFTVPTSVPPGNYYVSAFIRNDGGASQGSFPFGNNYAFSRTTVQVKPPVGSLQVTINPAAANSAGAGWRVDGGSLLYSGDTAGALSVGNHTLSFKPTPGWKTPGNQAVTISSNTTTTTTGTYIAIPPLSLSVAQSLKTHNGVGLNINLPLSGTPGVECRTGGASGNHTLVFTFNNSVVSGTATVTGGSGSVAGSPAFSSANQSMTVNLTSVANAQTLSITLSGVTDDSGQTLANTVVNVGFLLGDTNGDRFVNSGDALQTRNAAGQTTNQFNYRSDVNLDGAINSGDTVIVRGRSGTGLP